MGIKVKNFNENMGKIMRFVQCKKLYSNSC